MIIIMAFRLNPTKDCFCSPNYHIDGWWYKKQQNSNNYHNVISKNWFINYYVLILKPFQKLCYLIE